MSSRGPNKEKEFTCSCGTSFKLRRALKKGVIPRCPKCVREDANARSAGAAYHRRPEYQKKMREWQLQEHYGIGLEEYDKLLDAHGGVCAICKEPPADGKNLPVDHDHATNTVRGLLCHRCNMAIGVFKDNKAFLQSAIAYLNQSKRGSWDDYFVEFARLAATRSKDVSSKVGAVIVLDRLVLSTGYNGFPRGVNDNIPARHERPAKYSWTVHAEENSLLNAARHGIRVEGASLYVTPFSPCVQCAKAIASCGIKEVVVDERQTNPRFAEEFMLAKEILNVSGVLVRRPD